MAKVDLDESIEFVRDFSHWVANTISDTDGETQVKVAKYLGISQPALSSRIKGHTPWSLREYMEIQIYFGKEFKK